MKRRGFTLIELLVVLAIIGTLSAVGVVAYNGYTETAKLKASEANFKSINNYLLAELTKCETDSAQVIFKQFSCSSNTEPQVSLITNFFDQSLIYKNPYNLNKSALVSSTPCSSGQIAITKKSQGIYSVNFFSPTSQQIITNTLYTKWVPVNTGSVTTWTQVNTGCSVTWTQVNTGSNVNWNNVGP